MKIVKYPQLQTLVKEGLPTSLFMLELIGCPMLKPRYLKGEGQDWHKIAFVPVIHMDGEVIFEQLTLRPAMDSEPHTLKCLMFASLALTEVFLSIPKVVPENKSSFVTLQDSIRLGFLPRNVAKWVAPLSDRGLFRFSGYVYSKEVLVTALEGSTSIVQMILDLPFQTYQKLCNLNMFLQYVHWLHQFRGLQASGNFKRKTSVQFSESEESDPDKTWRRLRNVGMLHDAIPYPNDRVNHPVHVKRLFDSNNDSNGSQLNPYELMRKHNTRAFQGVEEHVHRIKSFFLSISYCWYFGRAFPSIDTLFDYVDSVLTKAVGAVKTNSVLGSRLHICNYELDIVFIVPPSDANSSPNHKSLSLDDIILPFVVPAPKYRPSDTPATKQAMREALAERAREISMEAVAFEELMEEEEIADEEEEVLKATDYVAKEREDEKAYADILWSQS
ncbi:hypothetical protein TEA_024256 [Camellia sinensis var. sinensis]|uniref:Uncharacterized protein n=1 Tax=Camellia sinensis var. sinensis TaxID=542762 RepID=A0A4S4D3X7_CAMSN|nr:hypothetical protein TEA_024256 [Camellia sinensis var. sinensis]